MHTKCTDVLSVSSVFRAVCFLKCFLKAAASRPAGSSSTSSALSVLQMTSDERSALTSTQLRFMWRNYFVASLEKRQDTFTLNEKTHIKLKLKAEALYWRGGNQWRNKSQAFQATHRQHYYRQQKQELALLHERFILNLEGEVMCPAPTSCFNPQGPYKQFMPHRGA